MKKACIVILLALMLILSLSAYAAAATIVDSGTCGAQGDNLTWTLDSDGVLTISGEGAMKDYPCYDEELTYYTDTPWWRKRSSISTVVFLQGVTSIADCAFLYCDNLTSITIPNSVVSIGNQAFYECYSLTSVTIPESITNIGYEAFQYCSKLGTVYFLGTAEQWNAISIGDNNDPLIYAAKHFTITTSGTCGAEGDNLTWTLDSDGVLTISGSGEMKNYPYSDSAPWYNQRAIITSLVIGNNVTSIGDLAFVRCSGLTSLTIPDSVISIGDYAFSECIGLTSVTIPDSITSIGEGVFAYCRGLTSLSIPDSVTSIGDWAFRECSNLTSVIIPDSVTSLGAKAFYECRRLTSVIISDNITCIGDCAFYYCDNLTSISIPNNVTSIGQQAFNFCSRLTSVNIPNSVTSIGEAAFNQCISLAEVHFNGTEEQWNAINIESYNDPLLAATLICVPALRITSQPVDFTGKAGSTIRFTVAAEGDGLSYQWYFKRANETSFNKSTLAAGIRATFTMTMADKYDGWQYYCVVTDTNGNTVQSDTVTIHKAPTVDIITQPVDFTGPSGTTITFTVAAQGEGLTYQWYYKKTDATTFVKSTLASGTKATYKMRMADKYDGWQYRCIVTDAYGNSAVTDTVTVHKADTITITAQPVDYTGAAGATFRFTVAAQGEGLTYQWYYKKTGAASFAKSTLSSASTAALTNSMKEKYDGWQYYCLITDQYGRTAMTDTVTIHLSQPPQITSQPQDVNGFVGDAAVFSVAASGTGLTYQWQYKTPSGTWKAATSDGNQTPEMTVPVTASRSGYQYRCIIKDSYGGSTTSNAVTLTVIKKAGITSQPVDYTGVPGSTITFTVCAEGEGLSYQWWYKKTGAASFVKSTLTSGRKATFTMNMAAKYDGWQYYCVVTDAYGNTARSNTVTIHLSQPLQITSQPVDFTGAVGSTIRFTVGAAGDGLTYQWYFKKTGATSFTKSTVSSAQKATFTMKMAEKYDGWQYRCIITDAYGNVDVSDTVTIHLE